MLLSPCEQFWQYLTPGGFAAYIFSANSVASVCLSPNISKAAGDAI